MLVKFSMFVEPACKDEVTRVSFQGPLLTPGTLLCICLHQRSFSQLSASMEEVGQRLIFVYDGVLHDDAHHRFYIQGRAAGLLGAAKPLAPAAAPCQAMNCSDGIFCDIKTGEALDWNGRNLGQRNLEHEQAFAFTALHGDVFLIAIQLPPARHEDRVCWIVVPVYSGTIPITFEPLPSFVARNEEADTSMLGNALRHLRPLQQLLVIWRGRQGAGNAFDVSVQAVRIIWSTEQLNCLKQHQDETPAVFQLSASLEVLMKGRKRAFTRLRHEAMSDAMMIVRRDVRCQSTCFLNVTFLVICRFPAEPSRYWSRKVQWMYSPSLDDPIWHLEPNSRVQGQLVVEWRQVGCPKHLALGHVRRCPDDTGPVLERTEKGVRDVFEGGAEWWTALWRGEVAGASGVRHEVSGKLWRVHMDAAPGVIEIMDAGDDDIDVALEVKNTFESLDGVLDKKVKYEILKDSLGRRQIGTATAKEPPMDPYQHACEALQRAKGPSSAAKLRAPPARSAAPEVQDTKVPHWEAKTRGESWQRRGGWQTWRASSANTWSHKPSDWQEDRWKYAKRARITSPRPARDQRVLVEAPLCMKKFQHRCSPMKHALGDAAADERFRPLRQLRFAIETFGTATEGAEEAYAADVCRAIWELLPLLNDAIAAQAYQEIMCSIGVFEKLGLQWSDLCGWSLQDIQVVFQDFAPEPTRLASADWLQINAIPVASNALERLACSLLFFELLVDGPSLLMVEECLAELPTSWKNSTFMDKLGYRSCILRDQDLVLLKSCPLIGDALAGTVLFSMMKRHFLLLLEASSTSLDHPRWASALLSACEWAVFTVEVSQNKLPIDLWQFKEFCKRMVAVSPGHCNAVVRLVEKMKDALRSNRKFIPRYLYTLV